MADDRVPHDGDDAASEERIPVMQHILENPFLLLFIGVAVPTVLYTLWGVMEIAGIPVSPLGK